MQPASETDPTDNLTDATMGIGGILGQVQHVGIYELWGVAEIRTADPSFIYNYISPPPPLLIKINEFDIWVLSENPAILQYNKNYDAVRIMSLIENQHPGFNCPPFYH